MAALRFEQRLLDTLQSLLELSVANVPIALVRAADLIAAALGADKVDAFFFDPTRNSLVALGTSTQPLSVTQRQLGLDVLQIANGGRGVQVFRTGTTFVTGRTDEDEGELRGVREALGVRSTLATPLVINSETRGVLMVASLKNDYFTNEDVHFTETVAQWLAMVAHNSMLVEEAGRAAHELGRRTGAEELVTVLAHDLRNHLAPLDMRLNLLLQRAQHEHRADDAKELALCRRSLARFTTVINDILDVSRVDQGLFELHHMPVDLVQVVEDAAALAATPTVAVEVRAAERPRLACDPARIRQVLDNLLANAVKHSPRSGAVTVLVATERRADGEHARVEVIDDGPGVPPEVMPRVFDRFVTNERGTGGLGLGLFLAKQIAVMHGGDLCVQTAAGRGASFVLRLPLRADDERDGAAPDAP